MVQFWACQVTGTQDVRLNIPPNYVLNIVNATLTSLDFTKPDKVVSLGIKTKQIDGSIWNDIVCHFGSAVSIYHTKLDLVIGSVAEVKFFLTNKEGKVNLTGYFQPCPSIPTSNTTVSVSTPTSHKTVSASPPIGNKNESAVSTTTQERVPTKDFISHNASDKKVTTEKAKPMNKTLLMDAQKDMKSSSMSNGSGSSAKKRKRKHPKGNFNA